MTRGARHSRASSPRPWGCFQLQAREAAALLVFPTPVGVFPSKGAITFASHSLPHARGGVSFFPDMSATHIRSSPRPWGCFHRGEEGYAPRGVFPTPVGVFPSQTPAWSCKSSLPHARGGVSSPSRPSETTTKSSPRPWGCFLAKGHECMPMSVFPTPVGVFLAAASVVVTAFSLPHARGGVSHGHCDPPCARSSSPRPWGCFPLRMAGGGGEGVFPTPVGVFLG